MGEQREINVTEYVDIKKIVIKEGMTLLQSYQIDSLWEILKVIHAENLQGDLVETGVYKGGAAVIMQFANLHLNMNRDIYLYDSFKGLPNPKSTKIKNPDFEKHSGGQYSSPKNVLVQNLRRFNFLKENIHIIDGWFENTLVDAETKKIALLRFDGDMYSSTLDVLNNLYDKVVDRGFIIIDDYCLNPCRIATEEFRKENGIEDTIFTPYNEIAGENDHLCASYWRKGIKI